MQRRDVALIVFYDEKYRVLLQDRKKISKAGEEWGFFGGGIEEGETPEQAVVRETKEELGYNLEDYEYIGNYKNTVHQYIINRHIFVSPLEDKMKKFILYEGEDKKLFSIQKARELKMVPGDSDALDVVAKYFNR